MYDVTDPDSFIKVKKWVKELRKMLGNEVSIAIIGNKSDLLPPNEQSDPKMNSLISEAINYSATINSSGTINSADHYVTSAKLNRGIDETFLGLTKKMMERSGINNARNLGSPVHSGTTRTLRLEDEEERREVAGNSGNCNC